MKKVVFALIAVGIGVLVGALLVEVLAIAAFSLRDGEFVPARERLRRVANTFVEGVSRDQRGCQYIDSLFPHPYLAFVHNGTEPCGRPNTNNIGLHGEDFPAERRRDRFVVLLTGGSVAAQFAQIDVGGPKYLEAILNASFVSPTGQPFVVLNGADGAWKQPQQAILFLLYSSVVDAVVTLDGFNEALIIASGGTVGLEHPSNNFLGVVNPLSGEPYGVVVSRLLLGRLVGSLTTSPVLSHSHAVFGAVSVLRRLVNREWSAGPRRPTIEGLFALPSEWDGEKRIQVRLERYQRYIRDMNAVANRHRVLIAHFIQPVPAIEKPLTPEERAVVGDLSYRGVYERMTDALLRLRGEGVQIFSLLSIFRNVTDTIYADHIHCERDARGESRGYRLMAEEVARTLGETWKLAPKR
ncbi:MAG: hypothetical protein L0027_07585 [Candidatus Rokubacteria bacterium]|nr:hypothetical protein [Candidatus Rokubacteria bacterium]